MDIATEIIKLASIGIGLFKDRNKLKSRSFLNQQTESKIAINILNTMTALGMPVTQKCA